MYKNSGFKLDGVYTVLHFLNGTDGLKLKQRANHFFVLPCDTNFVASRFSRFHLRKCLASLRTHFDFIFIDSHPASINDHYVTGMELSLCASDRFIIPLLAKKYAVDNADVFLGRVFSFSKKYNKKLLFLGFFFSSVLTTSKKIVRYSNLLHSLSGTLLFETFIRIDIEIENAILEGKTIFQFNPNCRAAEDYRKLTHEFLKKLDYVKK